MSAPIRTPASAPAVPARARALAGRLAGLFEADQQIVVALNDAHHQLAAANDRLWTDPIPDPLKINEQIRCAFYAYQQASEQRRQLAVEVGELSAWLTDALTGAGHTCEQARSANVYQLAAGTWQPTRDQRESGR